MRTVKLLGVAVVVMITLFGLLTLAALEGPEVVVVHTRDPSGNLRTTRTWVADHDGFAWIEAANPEREFYRSIVANKNPPTPSAMSPLVSVLAAAPRKIAVAATLAGVPPARASSAMDSTTASASAAPPSRPAT